MRLITTILVICLSLFACKSKKNAQTSSEQIEINEHETNMEVTDTYRLIVSFYSPGNGIDHRMKNEFTEFVAGYDGKPVYENISWGKEGEVDLCFVLNKFSAEEQEVFVHKAKEILSKSERVHVYENQACKHKR